MGSDELSVRARQVRVLLRGIRAFGSPRAFTIWLNDPCPQLGNRTPLSLLTCEAGIPAVEAVIDARDRKLKP